MKQLETWNTAKQKAKYKENIQTFCKTDTEHSVQIDFRNYLIV